MEGDFVVKIFPSVSDTEGNKWYSNFKNSLLKLDLAFIKMV